MMLFALVPSLYCVPISRRGWTLNSLPASPCPRALSELCCFPFNRFTVTLYSPSSEWLGIGSFADTSQMSFTCI